MVPDENENYELTHQMTISVKFNSSISFPFFMSERNVALKAQKLNQMSEYSFLPQQWSPQAQPDDV